MDTQISPLPAAPILPSGVTLLKHLGIIQIEGEDAARFIHGMLTQDFVLLGNQEARLAALCSPKGRMLASFIGYKESNANVFLICHQSLIDSTIKRLSMFVLRAKAKLRNVTESFAFYGEIGGDLVQPWNKSVTSDGCVTISLYPALETARKLHIIPSGSSKSMPTTLTEIDWLWSEVRSGVATVSAAIADQLVPQMLNYESVGGVNFKKGCYPGQEVVARSQFRGTIKRRAYVVHSESYMQVGDLVFNNQDSDTEVGFVVQAAAAPQGGYDAIISCQIAATHYPLQLAQPEGALLELLPLGYTLLEDV